MSCAFPNSYPKDFIKRLESDGAGQNEYVEVYRISEDGGCNRDAFLCTMIQDADREGINRDAYLASQRDVKEYDISEWSTSCWQNLKPASKIYSLKEKYEHSPSMLKGTIFSHTGYSIISTQRESVRKGLYKASKWHIDWWIFENVDVSKDFKIMRQINNVYSKSIF